MFWLFYDLRKKKVLPQSKIFYGDRSGHQQKKP